jgi:hypothetical protein
VISEEEVVELVVMVLERLLVVFVVVECDMVFVLFVFVVECEQQTN